MIGKRIKSRFALFSVVILILCNQDYAFADGYKYIRVNYTTLDRPIVQTSANITEVVFSVYANYAEGSLLAEDLECIHFDGTRFQPELRKTGENEYLILCKFQIKPGSQSGLQHVLIGSNYMKPQNFFAFIPANAVNYRELKVKDSFGQVTFQKSLNYENLIKYAMIFGADIAINPPDTYKYPEFPLINGELLIFDSKYTSKSKFKVVIDKTKRTFSFNCPNPYLPKSLSKKAKLSRTLITFNDQSSVVDSKDLSTIKYSYATKPYKGQRVTFTCTRLAQIGQTFVSYYESEPVIVDFR